MIISFVEHANSITKTFTFIFRVFCLCPCVTRAPHCVAYIYSLTHILIVPRRGKSSPLKSLRIVSHSLSAFGVSGIA